ncbi:unnamed protein product [Cyclocybe aegerita]|uniref:Uncharacterized protein n=1 Tax=Cyclocybe aegerita TaxID=1973307 RepID=A0A8S0VUR7_CYCAE|nr:unnamed protein product [Cyclocybe aegerita]
MPRIRKKTSNRVKVNDRAKLKKKVRDGKKKKAKLAKKNVQWKSKKSKDPGIPNEFPYKDQILAEVAKQRRLAADEKQKKKEEKQKAVSRARAIARGEVVEDEEDGLEEDDDKDQDSAGSGDEDNESGEPKGKKDLNVGAESIASLSAKIMKTGLKPRPKPVVEEAEESDEEEEVPMLVNCDLPNLKAVLEKTDVVLEVLDSRDPLAYRSKHVEELAQENGKKLLFVVNKIDLCPREALSAWTGHLRADQPTLLLRSASSFLPEPPTPSQHAPKKGKGKAKVPVDDAVGSDSILSCLAHWAKEKNGDVPLNVAIVGVANVGKSSLINSLLKRAALPVYAPSSSSRGPTTTELPQEVSLEFEDQKITLIDTPGLSFISEVVGDAALLQQSRARDILLRSKGRIDRLKDPGPPIEHIVSRANTEDLMLLYSLPAFAKGDSTAFLSGVARANQLVKKRGALDLAGAARVVLRDWSVGKLARFSTPPAPTSTGTDSSSAAEATSSEGSSSKSQTQSAADSTIRTHFAQLYAKDDTILAALPTRKELRKKGGLVRFSPGAVDARRAAVEEDWAGLEDSEEEQSDADEHALDDLRGMDVDEEEEDNDEEEGDKEGEGDEQNEDSEPEEDAVIQAPLSSKQKRKRGLEKPAPERPTKKVTFERPSKRSKPAQQRPLEPIQGSILSKPNKPTASSPSAPTKAVHKAKSPSKAASSAAATAKKALSEPKLKVAKVANVKPKTKTSAAAAAASKDADEQEDYDFGKFF